MLHFPLNRRAVSVWPEYSIRHKGLPDMSNCCCLPDKAGGVPACASRRSIGGFVFEGAEIGGKRRHLLIIEVLGDIDHGRIVALA